MKMQVVELSNHVSLEHHERQQKYQQQIRIRLRRTRINLQDRSPQKHIHYSNDHEQQQQQKLHSRLLGSDDRRKKLVLTSKNIQQKKNQQQNQHHYHQYDNNLNSIMNIIRRKRKISEKKPQDLGGLMVTIDKPLHAICMLLLLIPLTLTTCSLAQRINPTTSTSTTSSTENSGIRPGYKDTGLPIIDANSVDTNLSNIDAIVNSAFDDVNTTTNINNNNNTNSNRNKDSTSREEGAFNDSNTGGNSGGGGGDGGFSMSGLSTKNTGINSDIPPPEDKQRTLEVVRQAHQNLLEPVIKTNKSNAFLSCETGEMIVKINFTEPFRGVAYADYDRSSPCKFFGDGSDYYEMRLPLKGCGTKQEAPRLFLNNIIVRYHRLLELEEDEIKTIVCRYPPPQAPPPPPPPVGPPERIIDAPPEPAKLTQYEPLVIIAGLLFFTLMMLGLGAGSYLVKRRNIKPIHTPLPPPPLTGLTDHETYLDNQSIITTDEIDTFHKNTLFYAQPHLDTQYIDETFVTTTHEIDTLDDIVHHTDTRYYRPIDVGTANLEDTFITNQEDVTTKDVNTLTKLTPMPKYLVKNIEDTFITKVDEIDETEQISTIHRKKIKKQPPTSTKTITYTTDETTSHIDEIDQRTRTVNNNTTTFTGGIPNPIKSKLTTTDQFKHLQTIVDIFEETHTTTTEKTTSDHYIKFAKDSLRQRFGPRIQEMPHFDRTTLRSLLTEDETFRSLVIDTTMDETLVSSIRQNQDYTNKLTVDTWNLFEEVLAETTYMYNHRRDHYKSEERSYHEESKAQIYEQIGQQQHYYNYDHVKQLPMTEHVADPDFDSRTYTKSSGDSESRESLSPELARRARRIKGRREQRPSHQSSEFWDLEQRNFYNQRRPHASIPSLLSDPDLQPQTFDGMNSDIDTASIPDYGDNLLDEPASLQSLQQRGQHHNRQATTKGSYNNKAYVNEEQYYATATSSYLNHNDNESKDDDYSNGGYQNKSSPQRDRRRRGYNESPRGTDQDTTTDWTGHRGGYISNPDQYDNEENFPVYISQGDQESSSYQNHRGIKSHSSRKKKNNQR